MSPNIISELQAINLAESFIEGTVVEMTLDKGNGLYLYEIELRTSNGKVEVVVDAITGEVLEKSNY